MRAAAAVLAATGDRFAVHLTLDQAHPGAGRTGRRLERRGGGAGRGQPLAGNAVPRHELLQFAAQARQRRAVLPRRRAPGAGLGRTATGCCGCRRCRRRPPCCSRPPISISTAEAYGWVDEARHRRAAGAPWRSTSTRSPTWGDIGRMAGNDFESVVFARHPPVRAAFEALAGTRPLVCRMSGSGSTLFADLSLGARPGGRADDARPEARDGHPGGDAGGPPPGPEAI